MKKIILFIYFLFFSISICYSQNTDTLYWGGPGCCPTVISLELLPSMPDQYDSIFLILTVATPNSGSEIEKSHFIKENNIYLMTHHWDGYSTSPKIYKDTFALSKLSPGYYNVNFTCYMSSGPDLNIVDTAIGTSTFNIINTSIIEHTNTDFCFIYPNPVDSEFQIINIPSYSNVKLYTINGKLVKSFDRRNKKYYINNLSSGIYICQFIDINSGITRKILIKE